MKNESSTYLCFSLNEEHYALKVMNVLEVIDTTKITTLPEMPKHISGIIDFRGEVITVTDLRKRFSIEGNYHKNKFVIIVMEIKQNEKQIKMGAIADKVRDVFDVKENDIKQISHIEEDIKNQYLAGMIKRDDEFVILLDVNKIFSEKEIELIQNLADIDVGDHEN